MHDTTFHFYWEFQLRSTPVEMWPYISNTNHLNAYVGQPAVDSGPRQRIELGNGRFRLKFKFLGVPIEWVEEPFEWIYPERYGILRYYSKGPMTRMRVVVEMTPTPGGGSRMTYYVGTHTDSLFGRVSIPLYIGTIMARRVASTVRQYDEMAIQKQSIRTFPGQVQFATGGHTRLLRMRDQLLTQGVPPDLLTHLIEAIEQIDELEVSQLRPYVLADEWGVPRRAVLEMFLRATSIGMLDFQWNLLCPLCRNTNASGSTLGDINAQVHCPSCNIDYTVNFDRSVELTFSPNPAVRPAKGYEFCIGGPYRTPHIVVQQIVPPGAHHTVNPSLELGRYRLRTLQFPGGQYLLVDNVGETGKTFYPDPREAPNEEVRLISNPTLHFLNTSDQEQVFILERTAWSDQAVTAAEVTALQLFRSLFSREALRPGERIAVGSITIVFTDLRGSTRLYREIGDAPAFGRVMNHFDVLRDAIDEEGGAIVKTIGDAVMAVFQRPVGALRAMLKAQRLLANPPDGMLPLRLKVGFHTGACIAVTLNDRLDYFGSVVNIAARLEGLSSGEDMIITNEVRTDHEVDEMLKQGAEQLVIEPFTKSLKGFDTEVFDLWRVIQMTEGMEHVVGIEQPAEAGKAG